MIAIYLFYDVGHGKQRLYTTNGIEHCNVICFDGRDFVFHECQPHGIGFRRIIAKDCVTLIRNVKRIKSIIRIIAVHISDRHKIKWFPLWIRSCNELCRHISGINVGLTFNPTHLIKKLLKYDSQYNYEIIYQWSRHERRQ